MGVVSPLQGSDHCTRLTQGFTLGFDVLPLRGTDRGSLFRDGRLTEFIEDLHPNVQDALLPRRVAA